VHTLQQENDEQIEHRIVRVLFWRLIPLLCACFVAAFLDRVNVGFAKLSMLPDLGLSETAYAVGAGVFFVGYFFFEVPSNALLVKVGARLWIARIMIVWGLISAAMACVRGEASFYALRFLLGAAEAGFFPGVIYLLSIWFPRSYRTRAVSSFMVAAVFSFIVGSPLSGWLMDHPAFGLRGWQWLFLVEAAPSLVLGVAVLLLLPDGPSSARWLSPSDKQWLGQRLERDKDDAPGKVSTFGQLTRNGRVWHLSAIYFLNVVGGYGLDFFVPTLMHGAFPDLSKTALGFLLAVPPLVTIPVMIAYGRRCDRKDNARESVAWAAAAFAVGLAVLALQLSPWLTLLAMTVCSAARWSLIGPFWGLPGAVLGSSASALGIAFINSVGNLGGQAGPVLLSRFKTDAGSFAPGLWLLCGLLALCSVLALGVHRGEAPR
jgi:MFS transporter, ACS family, tartrate transporter